MKIGLVLDDTLDTPDGVQQYVLQVGRWLTEQGHDVHYIVGHTERTDIPNIHSLSRNLQVRFNGNRMSMSLLASKRKLRTFLQDEQFDVLHVQMPYSPFLAGKLLKVAPARTAVIGTFHILPYSSLVAFANRGLALLNQRTARRFDRILAVSEPAKDFARRIYGYECAVIPNPVRLADFTDDAPKNGSIPTIVFLGRLVERKGAQYLLRAIAYMRTHALYTSALKVEVGGKGELLAELQQYVREQHLEDVVTFHGFIDESAKAAFIAQADLAVYPSTGGESFGIVLLEAFAASPGVVLAGNNPGYASVMSPYPDQLFDPRNIPEFAGKLAQYLADQQLRTEAAHNQRQYVKQFDISVVGGRLVDVYTEVLQSRP